MKVLLYTAALLTILGISHAAKLERNVQLSDPHVAPGAPALSTFGPKSTYNYFVTSFKQGRIPACNDPKTFNDLGSDVYPKLTFSVSKSGDYVKFDYEITGYKIECEGTSILNSKGWGYGIFPNKCSENYVGAQKTD